MHYFSMIVKHGQADFLGRKPEILKVHEQVPNMTIDVLTCLGKLNDLSLQVSKNITSSKKHHH